jgi:hypothetical protein
MSRQKTVRLRLWGQSVSAYAQGAQVYAYDDVAGHYVSVEHLITQAQIRYVRGRTLVAA